ncbi:uncharacterized protein LOC135688500 isoform X2 [Rhopilema esculentum]|uniref:uncharacterized protein LOC135688500 isoform X2 n=1 Tax=Rhopilema esculentum TaxID=499914 RepID=UPI0031D0715A
MAGRFEVMIIATGMLTLAFIMACVSTGSNGWVRFEQSGKDPTIISLWADQGLFEQCVKTRLRGRAEVSNCYSVSSTYNGQTQDNWEKAVAGLMVTATVIMGIAVVLSGFLMLSSEGRSGILSDVSPVIIGNIAAVIAVIALIIYNSKYESIRNKLIGVSEKEYVDDEVTFGYSLYVGWLSSFIHFINIFFYFIYKAWAKHTLEKRRKGKGLVRTTHA